MKISRKRTTLILCIYNVIRLLYNTSTWRKGQFELILAISYVVVNCALSGSRVPHSRPGKSKLSNNSENERATFLKIMKLIQYGSFYIPKCVEKRIIFVAPANDSMKLEDWNKSFQFMGSATKAKAAVMKPIIKYTSNIYLKHQVDSHIDLDVVAFSSGIQFFLLKQFSKMDWGLTLMS